MHGKSNIKFPSFFHFIFHGPHILLSTFFRKFRTRTSRKKEEVRGVIDDNEKSGVAASCISNCKII
jgi:hypothetical protein